MAINSVEWVGALSETGVAVTAEDEAQLEGILNTASLPSLFGVAWRGNKYALIGLDGAIVSPEAQDVFDLMTGLVAAEQTAIADFVDSQVLAGNWGTQANSYTDSLVDYFTHYGLQTSGNSLTSWRNVFTAVNSAATHSPGNHFAFNGTTSHILSKFIPSSSGVAYILDDAIAQVFIALNNDIPATGASEALAVFDGTDFLAIAFSATNNSRVAINTAGTIQTISSSLADNALHTASRIVNTRGELYRNNVLLATTPDEASNGLPTQEVFVGARNSSGTPSNFFDGNLSSVMFGAGVGFDRASWLSNLVTLNAALAAV